MQCMPFACYLDRKVARENSCLMPAGRIYRFHRANKEGVVEAGNTLVISVQYHCDIKYPEH